MKKLNTFEKIINASISIFSTSSYEEVAISEICKVAKISNGSIYNYFSSKETLFKCLLDEICLRLDNAFKNVSGNSIQSKLESFIRINLQMAKKEFSLITIYRDGQYKFPEYEQKLRKIYIDALTNIFNSNIDEIQYLYIMSGIRFINVRYANNAILTPCIKTISSFILNGCFNGNKVNFNKLKNWPLYSIVPFNPDNKQAIFLQTGEKLFGENGYYNVKIQDITAECGIAIKTFYLFFKTKKKFLLNISEHLIHSIIFFLKYNTPNNLKLFEKHIYYIFLIISFFENAPYRYQLIRESEFIINDISKKYFFDLENFYMESFIDSPIEDNEKILLSNFLIGITHYLGIELFYTKNITDKYTVLQGLEKYLLFGIPH